MDMVQLKTEANRCYLCKKPKCQAFCPINTPIPKIVELFKQEKFHEAGEILFKNNPLSVVCSIVCPHEKQCRGHCIRGIRETPVNFSEIEHFISLKYLESSHFTQNIKLKQKIAVVGAGPSGIAIAFILAIKGYDITIFDKHEKIGGVLRYGIPDFRLPKSILDLFEERLIELNVKIRPNTLIGPVLSLDKLFKDGYSAIFIGTGAWTPKSLNIKGESLGNVNYAIDYLKSPSTYRLGNIVCVIGAGNVAMDAARSAKRNGAKKVYILYRKSFEDMPATQSEIKDAKKDGILFELFKAPLELTEKGVKCVETKRFVDKDGKVFIKYIDGTEQLFSCDSIIVAVSQTPKTTLLSSTSGLSLSKSGLLVTDKKGHTTRSGVFACGDVVTGAKTVIEAVVNAKIVAKSIDEYCSNLILHK